MEPVEGSVEKIVWMSTKDAAEYLGVSMQTLYRFIDAGSLPAFQMGRVIRLKYSDLVAFIEGQRIAPGTLGGSWERS